MSTPALSDVEAPDPAVARAERRLRVLEELTEIGMALARDLGERARAGQADEDHGLRGRDPADAFARISRAVRLTLALETKTDQALQDLKAGVVRAREKEKSQAAERARTEADEHCAAREAKVYELVFTAAEAEIDDVETFGDLLEALQERLEHDDAYQDAGERPVRETVERLCRDLDLTPDWSRWEGESWAAGYKPLRARFSPFSQPSRKPIARAPPEPAAPERVRAHALE